MNCHQQILTIAKRARQASLKLSGLKTKTKQAILTAMADALHRNRVTIKKANQKDLIRAKQSGLSPALLDRLELTEARIDGMIAGIEQVLKLPDPVGKILSEYRKSNGLLIRKVRVPIGVIGIIYEARPNVTADVAALGIKTSNALILKGGSEATYSNRAILKALVLGGEKVGLPKHSLQLIIDPDRSVVRELVQLVGKIDLIIPRGGEGLINTVMTMAKVPVIKHYQGICHVYVDRSADFAKALEIIVNAKCQRPGVCNAIETLLVDEKIAAKFLPQVAEVLSRHQVRLKGDQKTRAIISGIAKATTQDWKTEYLDLILSVKVVKNVAEAIEHINYYGSHHSDAIIAENQQAQQHFFQEVDSAAVYANASTRFTDGYEFGMGAEIGISTDKLHARGPMGLEELTTYKYLISGSGQVRRMPK